MFLSLVLSLVVQVNAANPYQIKYQKVLQSYVDNYGRVNYNLLSEKETTTLTEIISEMTSKTPIEQNGAFKSKADKLAFWMNLYNVIVLYEVALNYPIKSIQDIPDVWKKKHQIGNLRLSLDEIEHDYIRVFNEPRSHFAIICGAYSCPKLQRFVFIGDQLESQFKKIELDFYSNPLNFQIDDQKKRIRLSELFFWYTADFSTNENLNTNDQSEQKNIILEYLRQNSPEKIRNKIQGNDYEIEKMPWHWQLNEASL